MQHSEHVLVSLQACWLVLLYGISVEVQGRKLPGDWDGCHGDGSAGQCSGRSWGVAVILASTERACQFQALSLRTVTLAGSCSQVPSTLRITQRVQAIAAMIIALIYI